MKKWLIFFLILLMSTTPAWAQTTVDPAAYLPARVSAYIEIRLDDASLKAYNGLLNANAPMLGMPLAPQVGLIDLTLDPLLNTAFPNVSFQTDIQPWLADRIAIGALPLPAAPTLGDQNFIMVLPIGDQAGAQAFVQKVSDGTAPDTSSGIPVYTVNNLALAVGASVLWIGTPDTVSALLTSGGPENLTQNPAYTKIRAALPADAPITGYMSGQYLLDSTGLQQAAGAPGFLAPDVLLQAVLKLYPGQSALKDALLTLPPIAGVGFSAQIKDTRVDLTGVMSLNATYAAPTLPSATAGTDLLNLLPANSFLVFDSYDLSLAALSGVGGLTLVAPAVNSTFNSIVAGLQTAPQTATATPTPTPEPVTVDQLMAQVKPYIDQATSLMGMSLDQAYSLLNGEYAVAVFPGPGPVMGEALYLKSSDPNRIIDTVEHVAKLVLLDPTTGKQLVDVQRTTVSGTQVALLAPYGSSDRLALGVLNGNVLFLTTESVLPQVIDAAKKKDASAPVLTWRNAFGAAQEALLYADARTIDLYMTRVQRNPPLPIKTVAGSLDVGDNGLFTLHIALITGE